MGADPTVFAFLFRLARDLPGLAPRHALSRLVTGLANHYGATTCALHVRLGGRRVRIAAADDQHLARLDARQRHLVRAIEGRLLAQVHRSSSMTSALDIDIDDASRRSLLDAVGAMDVFAFPLGVGERRRGVLVLYLPPDARALDERDLAGLEAVGDLLSLVAEQVRALQRSA
jgi:hypothetical protein